jgi:acetyl esterase/lipase
MESVPEIGALRAFVSRIEGLLAASPKGVTTSDIELDAVPCRWYRLDNPGDRVILYLHGGGFCLHLPKIYDGFVSRLCKAFGAGALLPDYRLAPEHPFPNAVDDAFSAYCSLLERGVKPEHICIVGDSAGGCLTLTTLMQIRDKGLAAPACAIVLSPATDNPEQDAQLRLKAQQDPMFNTQTLKAFANYYLPGEADRQSPLAFPLTGSFEQLPPLQFHVGSTEILLDHSLKAAAKAQAAGVDVSLHVWDRMPHVHPLFHWLPESKQAVALMGEFVDQHLPGIR